MFVVHFSCFNAYFVLLIFTENHIYSSMRNHLINAIDLLSQPTLMFTAALLISKTVLSVLTLALNLAAVSEVSTYAVVDLIV